MIYTIVVQCPPSSHSTVASALNFAKALLEAEHCLYRVFFYGEAALIANQNTVQPQGELDLLVEWRELLVAHNLDAVVCIATALKRGVLDSQEAERYDLQAVTAPPYVLSGLGQLVDACAHSDRVITFV